LIAAVLHVLLGCRSAIGADPAIAKAAKALQAAAVRVQADPTRPVYHFRPLAQWMNDPCGGLRYKGYYHLFYQLNPYGDQWSTIHWGHARSRDLVYWERLPIALAPAENELRCNSGCVTINKQGTPMIFYTHVPNYEAPRDQRAAIGDSEMITWKRHPNNPILHPAIHGGPSFGGSGDPYVFEYAGRTFMVVGADSVGKDRAVPIYECRDDGFANWQYKGLMFKAPKTQLKNMEVPMFFRLDDKWVLMIHPSGPVKYWIGTFDLDTLIFQPETEGTLTHNYGQSRYEGVSDDRGFSSAHVFFDEQGRCIMYGWISGFKDGRGWNGCLALPRTLSLDSNGRLRQAPVKQLQKLRLKHFTAKTPDLNSASFVLKDLRTDTLEIIVEFECIDAEVFGLKLRRSDDGQRAVAISCYGQTLDVAGVKVPLKQDNQGKRLKLQIFLDKSVLEVFVNDGREAVAKVIYPGEDDIGIELFAAAGTAKVHSLDVWDIKPIWQPASSTIK
jgi:beta-fructofuranosidase